MVLHALYTRRGLASSSRYLKAQSLPLEKEAEQQRGPPIVVQEMPAKVGMATFPGPKRLEVRLPEAGLSLTERLRNRLQCLLAKGDWKGIL